MSIYREMREILLIGIEPLPYLVFLLFILPYTARLHLVAFLFVFSLVITFYYLLVTRSLRKLRSVFSERKEPLVSADTEYEGSTWWEQFWEITRDAYFGYESDIKPITAHTKSPYGRYGVVSIWSLVISWFAFSLSGYGLASLITSGNIDPKELVQTYSPLVNQIAAVDIFDFFIDLLPFFDTLSLEDQFFLGVVVFITGYFFLTGARHLTIISDNVHRRMLLRLVRINPLTKNEFLNTLVLVAIYLVAIELLQQIP